MKKTTFILAVFMVFTAAQTKAINFKENVLFTATLEGSQVVPAVASDAKGIASLMLNRRRDSISINISFIGLQSTTVGLYKGRAGENGTLLLDLSPFVSGNTISTRIFGTNVTGNMAKLMEEELYLSIGSAANPAGEIRGQIRLATDFHFVADMSGTEAVPAVNGPAYGLGSFRLTMHREKLEYRIICQNLSGSITNAKLYMGAIGSTGVEIADITSSVSGNVIKGSIVPDDVLLYNLFLGKVYLNIATSANPGGEVRSQLRYYRGLSFDAFGEGKQMIPPVPTTAHAVCVIRLSPALDTLFYDIVADDIQTQINYSHLHVGNAGVPYGALQVDFSPSIRGHRIKGFKRGTGIGSTTIARLLVSNLALALHTSEYPDGEVRGQIVRFAHEGYTVRMDAAQSAPGTGSAAVGTGFVSMDRDQEFVHYAWLANGLSGMATAAHFHEGGQGQTGGVVYDMTSMMSVSGNNVSANGYWKKSDSAPLTQNIVTLFETNKIYLNIHTASNPNGEIRGQVLKGQVFFPSTSSSRESYSNDHFALQMAPNPAATHLNLQIGDDMNTAQLNIRIVDVLGRTVYQSAYTQTIDLKGLDNGVYVLVVSDGKHGVSRRLVKG
jgi:hypothetical protein